MKKNMKAVIAIALIAILALGCFSACGSKKAASPLDKIKEAGKITLYTEAGFAPYEFLYNNEVVGVDIEIMKEVAKEIGVELVIEDVTFDTICASVKAGKCDVGAAGITITEERKQSIAFSDPYTSTAQYVVVLADNNEIATVEDLAGKDIGVQQGTTSDIIVENLINDGTLAGSTSSGFTAPAVAAASLGKLDAVVTDKLTAETIVANNDGKFKCFELVKADGSAAAETEYYGIAVSQENTELLEVINGVLKKLKDADQISAWEQEYQNIAKGLEG